MTKLLKSQEIIKKSISENNIYTLTINKITEPIQSYQLPIYRVKFTVELSEYDILSNRATFSSFEDALDKYYDIISSACLFEVNKWRRIPIASTNYR